MSKHILRAGKIGVAVLISVFVVTLLLYSASHVVIGQDEVVTVFDPLSDSANIDPNYPMINSLAVVDYCVEEVCEVQPRSVYENILNTSLDEQESLMAYKEMVVIDHFAKDPNYIPLTVEDLRYEFAGNPNLPNAVYDIASQYHKQALKMNPKSKRLMSDALLEQSIPLLEESILSVPENQIPDTYIMLAESYCRLGDYQQALSYYDRLLDEYPAYEQDWNIYFVMGRCLEKLADSGSVAYAQAYEQVTDLYLYIIQQYPECKAAKAANNWLAVNAQ